MKTNRSKFSKYLRPQKIKKVQSKIGNSVAEAAEWLRREEVVAVPTETVYGLAAKAWSEKAVRQVFAIKKRPLHNPLILHVASVAAIEQLADDIPKMAFHLLENFSPGPLTLLLSKKKIVPDLITAGLPRVAVRIPAHPLMLQLLDLLDFPLAAPSANPFGYISPTTAEHVARQLSEQLPYILDGGACTRGIESTVVGFDGEKPILYRLGAITAEQLSEVAGQVVHIRNHDEVRPVGPGMMAQHYSPATRLILTEQMAAEAGRFHPSAVGALVFQHPLEGIAEQQQFVLSPDGDLDEAARNLYEALHHLDGLGLEAIVAAPLPDRGMGRAINDRLRRAAA